MLGDKLELEPQVPLEIQLVEKDEVGDEVT